MNILIFIHIFSKMLMSVLGNKFSIKCICMIISFNFQNHVLDSHVIMAGVYQENFDVIIILIVAGVMILMNITVVGTFPSECKVFYKSKIHFLKLSILKHIVCRSPLILCFVWIIKLPKINLLFCKLRLHYINYSIHYVWKCVSFHKIEKKKAFKY